MKPTNIAAPDYFHKVVDCQWACPAHTPVPEYIRLIADGPLQRRLHDQLEVERVSGNPRTHLRPPVRAGLPARPRREGAGRDLPPEARRRRLQGRHPRPPAQAGAPKNGKRIALVGGGPASLTVARDLAPLGYHCTVFDQDPKAGGMMRTQIPKFRLPGRRDRRGDRLHPRPRHRVPAAAQRIDSLKALLAEDYDAIFVGSGAPRGRDLDIPGRKEAGEEHPHRHRLAVQRLVRPHRQDRQARHRARRRQHRDGLLPHLAPPRRRGRQGDRALRLRGDEGVALGEGRRHARGHPDPQLPGAEGIHPRQRQADRRGVREGQGRVRRQGPPQAGADRRAGPAHSRATTCWSRSARRTPSPGSSATSASSSTSGTCPRSIRRPWRRPTRRSSSAATRPSARRTSSGRWRTATTPRSRSTSSARGEDINERPLPAVDVVSQKMGIHEWSYDNDISNDKRFKVPHRDKVVALKDIQAEVELGYDLKLALGEAQRCLNCDVQTVFTTPALHRVRRLRRHLPDGLHHLHRERRGGRPAHAAEGAGAQPRPRTSTSPTA